MSKKKKFICNRRKFVDINNFSPFSKRFNLFLPIEITRGYNFRCIYCEIPRLFKDQKHRNIEGIVKIIKEYNKKRIKDLRFITPDASS